MNQRDALKSMVSNLINDKQEEASLDLHNYLSVKMREISGLGQTPQLPTESNSEDEAE